MRQTMLWALVANKLSCAASIVSMQLQAQEGASEDNSGKGKRKRNLVLMHIPYNFGHTVELAGLLPVNSMPDLHKGVSGKSSMANQFMTANFSWGLVRVAKIIKPSLEAWGHFNPDLNAVSEVTNCPMYFTPQKYWPEELAKRYFGKKTVFGLLRDPYERMVAVFRGSFANYGSNFSQFSEKCDINGGLQQLMKEMLTGSDPFRGSCTFVPQAEYFDGEHGVKLPVDNRLFPTSMNRVFEAHGYKEHIGAYNIGHVQGCDNVWAGDLNAETRKLIQQVYARDFELLCKHFGYCDKEENVCIQGVPNMCPPKLFKWDNTNMIYLRKKAA
eukprot:CAMPEP_0171091368 /NCGR_PEP_ID=MMETSP0766_2-20121228/32908_1 /TAXON_ID=439317 /ORGANISM="Gambierdiscus australes, Strain CAWD 149" /LENGTH=327 /DNA_ID=CAMNT_0011549469 /DNA_START=65 /DNA_END=1048 /DNA_ORIENTATION=-